MEQLEINTGGRMRFEVHSKVRILLIDGTISKEIYTIAEARSDRHAYILLRHDNKETKVHHRRVIPISVDGKITVVESGDKYWALCPTCGEVTQIGLDTITVTCLRCKSEPRELFWLGVKPMSNVETTTITKGKQPEKTATPEVTPEQPKVDLAIIAKLPKCELWTKKNVRFDHVNIDVQAHTLLYIGTEPRKLCFNTYNGTLGKRPGMVLCTDEFIEGTAPKDKKTPWFPVANLEKVRAKLIKDGYTRVE